MDRFVLVVGCFIIISLYFSCFQDVSLFPYIHASIGNCSCSVSTCLLWICLLACCCCWVSVCWITCDLFYFPQRCCFCLLLVLPCTSLLHFPRFPCSAAPSPKGCDSCSKPFLPAIIKISCSLRFWKMCHHYKNNAPYHPPYRKSWRATFYFW